jgi:hypothetical protein
LQRFADVQIRKTADAIGGDAVRDTQCLVLLLQSGFIGPPESGDGDLLKIPRRLRLCVTGSGAHKRAGHRQQMS